MKSFISIDPGIGGTGFCIWDESKILELGTLHFSSEFIHWIDKAQDITTKFCQMLNEWSPELVIMEYPTFMQGSGGYMVAAAGDLVKLSVLTGMLASAVSLNIVGINLEFVTPNQWKGQLPKSVTEKRIRKIVDFKDKRKISNHAMDAIGIGLWKLGLFK